MDLLLTSFHSFARDHLRGDRITTRIKPTHYAGESPFVMKFGSTLLVTVIPIRAVDRRGSQAEALFDILTLEKLVIDRLHVTVLTPD